MKIVLLLTGILWMSSTLAYEQVQLPFADGEQYACTQNSTGTWSHKYRSTDFDLDFALRVGTLIVAAHDGVIKSIVKNCRSISRKKDGEVISEDASCGGSWGNHIIIAHDNFSAETVYAHLARSGILVKVGQHVIAGQPIGFSGSSGNSTGPHLHFGVHKPFNHSIPMDVYALEQGKDSAEWFTTAGKSDFVCGNPDGVSHIYQSIPLNGSVFSAFQCASLTTGGIHCWRGDKGTDGQYHAAFCDDAHYHLRYAKVSGVYTSQELDIHEGWNLCANHQEEGIDVLSYLSGNTAYGGSSSITDGNAPNLTIDFDIFQNGTEKKAEYGHLLTATQDVTLTVKVCNNSSTDTTEGRVKGGSKTDTRFWVRLPGQGNWSDLGREETKDSNPPRDD